MPIRWDDRNKRWRYEFDARVQGVRRRASHLLPKGWSKARADAFDVKETGRLYALESGSEDADPLIETAVELYLQDKQHLKSHATAQEHLAAIALFYLGRPMSELADIAREVNERRHVEARTDARGRKRQAHDLSDATVKQRLALLKAACRWGWKRHNLTKHDPTAQMVMPTVRNERHVYRGRAEMLRACRACTNWQAQVAIRVCFYTGMPQGSTKNDDRRAIPVHPRIRHLLAHLPLTGPKITVQRSWERARDRAGLQGTTMHDLRHSAASEMVNAGVDLYTVGGVLGHRDARSTQRYAHLNTETLAAAVRKIGQKLPHKGAA
jgi:integrase